jgi:hypothetical protein
MKTTYGYDANTANAKVNSWRTVQRNQKSKGAMLSPMSTGHTEGSGNQRDSLSLQKGYMDVLFMFGTKSTRSLAMFNLAVDQDLRNLQETVRRELLHSIAVQGGQSD